MVVQTAFAHVQGQFRNLPLRSLYMAEWLEIVEPIVLPNAWGGMGSLECSLIFIFLFKLLL